MGSKDDMLRKYLLVIGIGTIIFGLIFFATSLTTMYQMLNSVENTYVSGFWEKAVVMAQATQTSGVSAFESMALGGICLYLARKISRETQHKASIDETSNQET